VLIEAQTYRHGGHSRADPATYRDPDEVAEWLSRDPLVRLEHAAGELGVDVSTIRDDVERRLESALESALRSPEPHASELTEDVWGNVPSWQF
jgi:pyruvate dehydrogenase E1 component alpha subunit